MSKKGTDAQSKTGKVTISNLHASAGDKEKVFEDTPEGRSEVAKEITKLLAEKAACFLQVQKNQHFKITGYDEKTNEWILSGPISRAPSRDTDVLVVPPMSGG